MNFNLKTTAIYQAISLDKNFFFKGSEKLRALSFILTFLFLAAFVFGIFTEILSQTALKQLVAGALLSLGLGICFLEISLFFNSKVKKPPLKCSLSRALQKPDQFNLAAFLDFKAGKVCWKSLKQTRKKKLREASKEILLFSLLNPRIGEINFVFQRAGLSFKKIRADLKKEIEKQKTRWAPGFEKIILPALEIASSRKKKRVGAGDILISFARNDPFFQRFLTMNDLGEGDIENLVDWYEKMERRAEESKKFWEQENLLKKGSIGKDWAAGYTITLDKYSFDLRWKVLKNRFREIVGHQAEVRQIERIMEKSEANSVLLVGMPGTGRRSIVEALAQRAFLGRSVASLNYKRILKFDVGQVASQIGSLEELEFELDSCFYQAAQSGNTILVIEEIHHFLREQIKPGTIDISGMLSRYLPLPDFKIIALTSYQGLHRIIERSPALLNLFEKVEVSEISEKETLRLLENFLPFFEQKHNKFVSYKALREILRLSSLYFADLPFPEKAVRLLDESMSWLGTFTSDKVLLPKHIKKVVAEKVEVPLEEMEAKEKETLLNLEDMIHQRIINQTEAVKEVSSALRRARAQIKTRGGPIGSFLFLGPTGVGKTETSKALAQVYFGSEQRMIRLDMSEFQQIEDIKRLLGGEGQEGLLSTPVRENPFSLVLLDEIEKAHPNILNLFLQILDEGFLTAGDGRKVSFKNTMIIATSNAGAELIRQEIRENKGLEIVKEDLLDHLLREGIFRPEFINRFDGVVVFKPLTKKNLLAICGLMLKKLAGNLRDKGIDFEVTGELKGKIVELGYSPEFGAREMRRVVQDKVENLLAKAILSGILKRGNKAKVEVKDQEFNLVIG